MPSVLQGAVGGTAGPWTPAQIHDTIAKIAAQPRYSSGVGQSLLGRLLRYLWNRFNAFLSYIEGSVDARIVVIAAVVIVVALIVARVVVARRLAEDRRRRGLGIRATTGQRLDYWTVAAAEAANGQYANACHALYSAVLDTLVRDGVVKFHASKTSGDYARDLRRAGAPAFADFRAFARHFDRVIFGETHVGNAEYERLRESAERTARVQKAA
ncbi:MAG TPA: DUF4129 domain-containing protein [Gemmatimonadaceae bacterium]|nr:DUF4129 domain-containing protein [Gemmatimonadaceae bacterium]